MKLSLASVYALRALAYLASNEREGKVVASHIIAKARGIPELFLLKVMRPLVQADLVRALKGPQGGYWLSRPANKITVLEVIEAVEGPLGAPVPDVMSTDAALEKKLQEVFTKATEVQRAQLGKAKISDLAGGAKGKG